MATRKDLNQDNHLVSKCLLTLIIIGIPCNLLSNQHYDSSWTIGEWLISYAGGFARRGLPGSLLHEAAIRLNISPIYCIWLISIFFFACLAGLLWRFCRRRLTLYILLSPMMLLGPIIGDYLVRKDTMLLTLFGFSLLSTEKFIGAKKCSWLGLLIVNILSIIAILSHESYGFWAIPGLFLAILYAQSRNTETQLKEIRVTSVGIYLLPSFTAFLACLICKGSELHALTIHQSWQSQADLVPSIGALARSLPTGAIEAIGWTIHKGLSLSKATLNDFSYGIWVPAAWLLTIYVCIQFFIADRNPEHVATKKFIVLLQLTTISPLFILGWDFGRWIFIWITSSALLHGYFPKNINLNSFNIQSLKRFNNLINKLNSNLFLHRNRKAMLLFLGIPSCCWTAKDFLASTPIGYLVNVLNLVLSTISTH